MQRKASSPSPRRLRVAFPRPSATLVIVWWLTWCNGDERRSEDSRATVPHFLGEQVRRDASLTCHERREHDAHITDVDGEVEQVQQVVEHSGRVHQARVDRPADEPAQRVPRRVVEPWGGKREGGEGKRKE